MSVDRQRVLIVGAGQAGARTALSLRQHGWQGEILLVGAESEYPYERPPLSKEVLTGKAEPDRATILGEPACAEQDIQLIRGEAVTALDLPARLARLGGGGTLPWDRLVIATGSRARELPLPGAHLGGVVTLRTAADALALREQLKPGASVVLVGGGFIGLEVAASATQAGCRVTVLETARHLLSRVVTSTIAEAVETMHRSHGVDVRTGARVEALEGVDSVCRVRLSDGSAIEADVVVVGIGALANDGLAIAAGMPCADGILVDESARTPAEHVYAVGDVARHELLWGAQRMRLESWENAELQAVTAARAITGQPQDARKAPWFWTDQFDNNLQILGYPHPTQQVVLRGSLDARSWCAFMLQDDRIAAACLWNAGRERRPISRLLDLGRALPASLLADTNRPLQELLKAIA
ncbi:FAD-dependent oxidoreductase [Ramlibacter sp. AW1]|uniref:FAD-dependent oxidoreductase n=1 Tax=Ramlibacter aurantiacus TaxID=2801330 RepID=A0A937D3C8_9BURK|nr:FAD-dependent oxidoreductase [Ramlibacter aurantiacus]MBL0419197.1 FAD-dependent oxidoreductase [Ramlibacter aurantiacus]